MKKVMTVVGALIVTGLIMLICTNMLGAGKDNPVESPATTPVVGASARPDTIREGMWRVGTDVKPGRYKTTGALDGLCYWHTARDTSDLTIIDQGLADRSNQAGYVTLKSGQYFKTSGCHDWHIVK
jgi:hypothetical protein